MSWHYQIRKRTIEGKASYDMVEMFDLPPGWTEESVGPYGETKDELLADLARMLHDAEYYPVFEEHV